MPKRGNLLSEFEQGVIQSLTEKRFLAKNGYKYVPYFRLPLLSPLTKKNRLKWAKETLLKLTTKKLNLEQVTFSDEKRFLLDGLDGCRKYWAKHNEIRKFFRKKLFSKSIVV
ncbi:hypothetical protein A3Q56_07465 [Intoshia linei]|uniref:Transposase Tc1-like domain-containing protein n=1 Tax=Intoshia linei TaxID=1819745 RepID=A0A177AS33_9BILA|nr:hypothetical protein A3Q56_07465 [Intoshia linei]